MSLDIEEIGAHMLHLMTNLPKKLTTDAIIEALIEIRFEHRDLWEVVVGKFAAAEKFKGFQQTRLPLGDMPIQLRDGDPNLRFQPLIQLQQLKPPLVIKIGPRVISVHAAAPYPGWEAFQADIKDVVELLFDACTVESVERIGVRYINALSPVHGIKSAFDLQWEVQFAGSRPDGDIIFANQVALDDGTCVKTSIATPAFVQGPMPPGSVVFVDVDVYAESHLGKIAASDVLSWIDRAHDLEKTAFFSLLPDAIIASLKEG
jgi:uncharacterized protein (TIGR04255 family)